MWLTVELVQALRRVSRVYREFSTKTTGPLPFELGFLRIRNDRLEPISDPLHIENPELFVRMISEFVEPGARIRLTRSSTTPHRSGLHRSASQPNEADAAGSGVAQGPKANDADSGPSGGLWTINDVGDVSRHDDPATTTRANSPIADGDVSTST